MRPFVVILFLVSLLVADAWTRDRAVRRKKGGKGLFQNALEAVTTSSEPPQENVNIKPCPGLIVLGMHRSGTSMLTGLLNKMGLETGGPLQNHRAGDNPRGYFERMDMRCVNDGLLMEQRLVYDHLTNNYNATRGLIRLHQMYNSHVYNHTGADDKPVGVIVPGDLTAHYHWQCAYTTLNFFANASNVPWLVKDPRMCTTYATWHAAWTSPPFAVPGHGPPAVLFTYRHPLDVALSLSKRAEIWAGKLKVNYSAEFEMTKGLSMWYVYNKMAVRQSTASVAQGVCRVVTSDVNVLTTPSTELNRIADALQTQCHLRIPRRLTVTDISRFHDPSLHQSNHVRLSEMYCTALAANDSTHPVDAVSNYTLADHAHFAIFTKTFSGDHSKYARLYREVMRVYCGLESGRAFKPGFEFDDSIIDKFK